MRAIAVTLMAAMLLSVACGSSDKRSAGPTPARTSDAPVPDVTPIARDGSPRGPHRKHRSSDSEVLQIPMGITMQAGTTYSTVRFAVDTHFVEPDGMAYPFVADADLPTFVSMASDDSGGVVFLAPTKIYTSAGTLVTAPSNLLSALSENGNISISDQSATTIGGVRATKVTVAPKKIPHAKWAYCGDAHCVPIIPLPNDSPYGLIKGFTYTYYFLTVHGRSIVISIEGVSGSGYKTFYKNAAALVKTIDFAK